MMTPHHATAQTAPPTGTSGSAPVTIVSPIPLPITGSTNVSGTITANQGGVWNVGITGTPSFLITNGASNPLIAQNIDDPDRHTFRKQVVGTVDNGLTRNVIQTATAAPADKAIIIDYVSVSCIVVTGKQCGAAVGVNYTAGIKTSITMTRDLAVEST